MYILLWSTWGIAAPFPIDIKNKKNKNNDLRLQKHLYMAFQIFLQVHCLHKLWGSTISIITRTPENEEKKNYKFKYKFNKSSFSAFPMPYFGMWKQYGYENIWAMMIVYVLKCVHVASIRIEEIIWWRSNNWNFKN